MIQTYDGACLVVIMLRNDGLEKYGVPDGENPLTPAAIERLSRQPTKQGLENVLIACGMAPSRVRKIDERTLLDIINGLAASRKECFRKHFAHAIGFSGGTLDCVCRHLVLYVSKTVVFSESPRDAIAVLLMLKHLPHVAFYDYWCGAVRELLTSLAKVGVDLGPRAGALLLDADLKKHGSQLPVSIPALRVQGAPSFCLADCDREAKAAQAHLSTPMPDLAVDRPPHPYTQCKICLLFHDRLHGEAHDCEGRDPNNVQDLLGLSSESSEHYNSLRTRHDRFLRNESPQRNLFLHKVIEYLHNKKVNLAHLERLNKELDEKIRSFPQFRWRLAVNEYGQVRVVRTSQ